MTVRIKDGEFVDSKDRILNLRGINVSGSSKLPTSSPPQSPSSLDPSTPISFVGRPFPLSEADEHFTRLRACGFTLLRFIVTWEAIEHAGPGQYDIEYLQYIRSIIEKAKEYEMYIYIDPHQDVWSRWTGGDGAPAWTLELCGFHLPSLRLSESALTHVYYPGDAEEFPKMIWPTNYFRLACATMFTLFWGGNKFAPQMMIGRVPVQHFLQNHFTNAMCALASRLCGLPNVVGYGTMNEPSPGYIGVKNLGKLFSPLKKGFMPTPIQQMALGAGIPQDVKWYSAAGLPWATSRLNEGRRSVWAAEHSCVWAQHGVWAREGDMKATLLRPDYFADADFGKDHYVPFAKDYAARIREAAWAPALPPLLLFAELPPADLGVASFPEIPPEEISSAVNASHWYDNITLYMGSFTASSTATIKWSLDVQTMKPVFGGENVRTLFRNQLHEMREEGMTKMGGAPTVIGEVGIPFDMDNRIGYNTADWSTHTEAMDFSMRALEENLLSFCIWCYASDHTRKWGDNWNREDLSIFSRSEQLDPSDINSGGRAIHAVVRPYAIAVAGTPTIMMFNLESRTFHLTFTSTSQEPSAWTEVFVPFLHYPNGQLEIDVSDGEWDLKYFDSHRASALLTYKHDVGVPQHTLTLYPKERERAAFMSPQSMRVSTKMRQVSSTPSDVIKAASKGEDLEPVLEAYPELANCSDGFNFLGYTPLIAATKKGRARAVRQLIEVKADLMAKDYRGRRALDWARAENHLDCINLLRAAEEQLSGCAFDDARHRVIAAVTSGDDISQFLQDRPDLAQASSPTNMEGFTALHAAARTGNHEAIAQLLEAEADPTVRDLNNRTALDWAIAEEHEDCVLLLRTAPKIHAHLQTGMVQPVTPRYGDLV